jgi:hypothetical protein
VYETHESDAWVELVELVLAVFQEAAVSSDTGGAAAV